MDATASVEGRPKQYSLSLEHRDVSAGMEQRASGLLSVSLWSGSLATGSGKATSCAGFIFETETTYVLCVSVVKTQNAADRTHPGQQSDQHSKKSQGSKADL